MQKLLVIAVIAVIAVCMFLYIRNNPVGADERPRGTMIYISEGRIIL